jgi:hypothetical protein
VRSSHQVLHRIEKILSTTRGAENDALKASRRQIAKDYVKLGSPTGAPAVSPTGLIREIAALEKEEAALENTFMADRFALSKEQFRLCVGDKLINSEEACKSGTDPWLKVVLHERPR